MKVIHTLIFASAAALLPLAGCAEPAATPTASATPAAKAPAMRSAANAAGERLVLCYECPPDNAARYKLYLERPSGERFSCISRSGDEYCYLTLPERLQWVEGTQELALMHFRDKQASRLRLLDILSNEVVEEAGHVQGVLCYAAIRAEDSERPQLHLRGKEADWRHADGTLVATFHFDAAGEEGWNAARLADTQVGGLRFASAPNRRSERVGLLPRDSDGMSFFARFALLEPGKKARAIHPLLGMDGLLIDEGQGESPFGWGIRLGWIGDDSFYASQCRRHGSIFNLIRLQRSAQGAVELGRTALEVNSGGRHSCEEEGASLILRAEDGSKLMTLPLQP